MTPNDAMAYAKRFLGSIPVDDAALKYVILNHANLKLWSAAPWRWSVGVLTPVPLVNDQQDYTLATVANMGYILQASLTNGEEKYDVTPVSSLPSTTVLKGRPSQMSYTKGAPNDTIRLLPVPKGYAAPTPSLLMVYKKLPTEIAVGNAGNDLETETGLPKQWHWVYQEIVLGKVMAFANSAKLGSVTFTSDGRAQYSGQLGVIEAAIDEMRKAEKKLLDSIGGVVPNG